VIAHQGRKGDADFLSLKQHSKLISKYLGKEIKYVDDLFSNKVIKEINNLREGDSVVLKNVREYKDEMDVSFPSNNFIDFSRNFDIYVNDAFSVSHRSQASIVIPPKIIPSCVGIHFIKEVCALSNFDISRKGVFLIGGAKVEDYLPIFNVLKNKENIVLASGVLANLLLLIEGIHLGYEEKWLKEKDYLRLIPQLKEILNNHRNQIILPVDFAFRKKGRIEKTLEDAPFEDKILDVGKNTVVLFKKYIKGAKRIFMKGPLGFSETPLFDYGTLEILKSIAEETKKGAFSLLGGGHLTTTVEKHLSKSAFSFISVAGGALIAYLSGEELPGIKALQESSRLF